MLWERVKAKYEEKEKIVPAELMRRVERDLMLQIVDAQWKDHLYSLDHLKEGIGLRGYGQRDPLVEYKKESFTLFQDMRRAHRGRDRPLPVVAAAGRRRRGRRRSGRLPCARRARRHGVRRHAQLQRSRAPRARPASGDGAAAAAAADAAAASAGPDAAARRRRRRADQDGAARRAEDRQKRSVLVRQRQEVQEMSRRVAAVADERQLADLESTMAQTKFEIPTPTSLDAGLRTALTFDDILLVPRHSTRAAGAGRRQHAAHAQHPPQRAAPERRHGHGHRVRDGHRHGAARRPRRHPQEPADRGAGLGSRSRQALRERDDRQPDHASARRRGSAKRSS